MREQLVALTPKIQQVQMPHSAYSHNLLHALVHLLKKDLMEGVIMVITAQTACKTG